MSKIEVNTVDAQCGSTITIGSAGKTVNVPGTALTATGNVTGAQVISSSNIVKSNALQASDGGNIVNQCGTTVTLGASGDTVTLASGASQSGFGRSGSVNWDTASIKTALFTAATGEGYFCNTSGGAFTVNLPAGVAGAIVAVADYTRTFATYNCTVAPNGAEKIGGVADDAILNVNGQSATFVYVDGTEGWVNVQETQNSQTGLVPAYVTASGGTPCAGAIVCTNYKQHTFTGPGTLTVSCAGNAGGSNSVDYIVVGAGGSGGQRIGAGGGAGGFREGYNPGSYTASPLATTALPVSATPYPITVGAGGPGGNSGVSGRIGINGSLSSFSTISSAGGGGGGFYCLPGPSAPGTQAGLPGGSGGGGGSKGCGGSVGGTGNTPVVSPAQGFPGAPGVVGGGSYAGGGGGGATVIGTTGGPGLQGGPGGAGATTSISATPTAYAGGGGGSGDSGGGSGGAGGGGAGSTNGPSAIAGTANTGGAGGGSRGCCSGNSGAGGSGVVIIRYKFQ
jgi:hypothetical protein